MRTARFLCVVLLLAALSQPCQAQFVRVPVVVPRPVTVPHVAVPHGSPSHGGDNRALGWVLGGLGGVAVIAGGVYVVRRWQQVSTRPAIIRIIAVPPGEAPESVRQAWVGLEFPVIPGQVHAEMGPAQGVLTRRDVDVPPSYAVEGRTAIAILESAAPEAAAWWRQHTPDILAAGYQLIFPAEVCERLDDLGS